MNNLRSIKLVQSSHHKIIDIYNLRKHSLKVLLKRAEKHTFWYRDTDADRGVIKQIFKNKDYELDRLKRGKEIKAYYQSILDDGKIPLIVDCGANIGASVIYFSSIFPEARILAIEPNDENYILLVKNTQNRNVQYFHCAIASTTGEGVLVNVGGGAWAYRLGRGDEEGDKVHVCTMEDIFSTLEGERYVPFIVKIDIEGGEKELFAHKTEWFHSFYVAIVELHDWLYPTQQTSQSFLQMVSELDRDFVYIRENIFSIKNIRPT